jgi:hypothetical protein
MNRLARSLLVALTLALFTAPVALAQFESTAGADRYFRIESEVKQTKRGTAVSGYLYNSNGMTAERVLLRVDGLDAAGQVVSSTRAYVLGGVPRYNRAYFDVRVPPGAASYRVSVVSFDFVNGGGGGGGGM